MRVPIRKPGQYTNVQRDPHMTQDKFDELSAELARLKRARPAAAAEVKRLADMGDLSENFGYQMAKNRLRGMNQRMEDVENHLKEAKIISSAGQPGVVQLGSTVTITREGKNVTYTVLGPTETNPEKGIISYQSPLGKVLMGRRAGDTVNFEQGKTRTQYTIKEIK